MVHNGFVLPFEALPTHSPPCACFFWKERFSCPRVTRWECIPAHDDGTEIARLGYAKGLWRISQRPLKGFFQLWETLWGGRTGASEYHFPWYTFVCLNYAPSYAGGVTNIAMRLALSPCSPGKTVFVGGGAPVPPVREM